MVLGFFKVLVSISFLLFIFSCSFQVTLYAMLKQHLQLKVVQVYRTAFVFHHSVLLQFC